jgi:hypothetical protein
MRQPCMRRLLAWGACLLMTLALAASGLGQKAAPAGGARKLDSFKQLRGCDLGARLDYFAIALQEDGGVTGYIIAYGPPGEGYGTASHNLHVMTNYLSNSRGLDPERVKTIYGGRYKDPKGVETEMWLVPTGARLPEPRKYKNTLKSFTGKYDEYVTSDHLYPDESDGPYTPDPTLASFTDALRERPATRAYIVVRSSPDAVTGAWRRVAKDLADRLEGDSGIAADRVKIIFAGYDKKLRRTPDQVEGEGLDDARLRVQLWILPEDAPPPAKEVTNERRPSEAALIGSLDKYLLYDPGNAKHIFEGLADVLNADRELRGCIIYHPSAEPPDPETEPGSYQLPRVDLDQLVQKWKGELATKYQIDEARLVIISGAATRESDDGTVAAWVVPPGAALPDAYPPPEEEEEYVEDDAAEVSPQ